MLSRINYSNVLWKKNGYPPTVIDEAYDEVLKQVENFKKYEG